MPEVSVHKLAELSPDAREKLLARAEADLGPFIEKVRPIVAAVAAEGDEALARFAREFDRSPVEADAIAATRADFDAAFDAVDKEMIAVLELAVDNVRRFHEAQMPEELWMKEMSPGIYAGERASPIPSVACYVPRGKGSFPSVVNMTVVPAVVAGVPRVILLTPPGPDGKVDAATLVAARLAGIEEVYKCGGAQAVAAAAYGTETVPRCVKFVGPGSPVGDGRQAPPRRPDRSRPARRPVRIDRHRRRYGERPRRGARPSSTSPSTGPIRPPSW